MSTQITLLTDPRTIPGVESITHGNDELTVTFVNGNHATVQRSPLSRFVPREVFDVYVPGAGGMSQVSLYKSPDEVIAMLGQMAVEAAGN